MTAAEIQAAPLHELPDIIAELAKLSALAQLRLSGSHEEGDRLLTAQEAAARLNVPRGHLYKTTYPFRVVISPGRVRFSEREIEKFIARRRTR